MESKPEKSGATSRKRSDNLKWIIAALLLILVMFAGLITWKLWAEPAAKPPESQIIPNTALPRGLQGFKTKLNIPLYTPQPLPEGWNYIGNIQQTDDNAIIYDITDAAGKKLSIAQQAKPPTTEEVNKTQEFKLSIGDAYTADVEGRTTGFVKTDKTLIIVSGASVDQEGVVVGLLKSLKPI